MPNVAQNVTGSGNLFTATGDVIQVSYHLDQPSAEDRRNLANLLGHVKRTWITDVLEHSVHEAALLELGMREEAGAVEHPWERVLETPAEPGGVLPPDRSISQVFEDVGRLLLILGEPGSGKTTTLLTLARECIHQAERDPTAPVPVVLSLSTWAERRGSIHDWLMGELGARYFVGRPLARRWLEQNRLLLFLDGLDEVAEDRRADCVEAIHAFVEAHGVPGMVVCCRAQEYRALPVRLRLGGAVLLLPLSQGQVDAYLGAAGAELFELRGALARSVELRAMAESPLMLGVMTLAFRGAPPEALRFDAATPAALRDRIFSVYVDRMFARRWRDQRPQARARAERSLRWLASGMAARGQSVFSIELLQPAGSLTSWKQFLAYTVVSRVLATTILLMIVCGLMAALLGSTLSGWNIFLQFGAIAGVVTGMLCSGADFVRLRARRRTGALVGLLLYVPMGIGGCLAAGAVLQLPNPNVGFLALPSALVFAVFFGAKQGRGEAAADIGTAGVLSWRWKAAFARSAEVVLLGTVMAELAFLLTKPSGILLDQWRLGLVGYVTYAAIVGMIGFLVGGWSFQIPAPDLRPVPHRNMRLRSAAKGTLFFGGLGATLSGLFAAVLDATFGRVSLFAIVGALFSGLIAFLWLGGIDLILHASLRLVVALSGAAPLHLRRFLDQAVGLVFLRRAGGGYMFIHRLLLEHFAARYTIFLSCLCNCTLQVRVAGEGGKD
jgi:eukaryotic-like serine/threonine-protein kinase